MDQRVERIAEKLLGIPYEHNGRSYKGVDCWGLIYLFFSEIGFSLPRDDGEYIPDDWYKKEPERYIKGLRTLGEEVGHYKNLLPLDIPYFRLYRNVITHSGVMLNSNNMLHVLINKEVRIDNINRRFWRSNYAGAIRITALNKLARSLQQEN